MVVSLPHNHSLLWRKAIVTMHKVARPCTITRLLRRVVGLSDHSQKCKGHAQPDSMAWKRLQAGTQPYENWQYMLLLAMWKMSVYVIGYKIWWHLFIGMWKLSKLVIHHVKTSSWVKGLLLMSGLTCRLHVWIPASSSQWFCLSTLIKFKHHKNNNEETCDLRCLEPQTLCYESLNKRRNSLINTEYLLLGTWKL